MFSNAIWQGYSPSQKVGKLCYQYSSMQSFLPIRDVLNDHKKGNKSEPNYETATYNWCVECNQPSICSAVKDGLSHILFITKYSGLNEDYLGRYFIVGYYEVGWTTEVDGRIAVRAKTMCFVPIEYAYEITDERWQRINQNGQTLKLQNLRWATQRVTGNLLSEIIEHLKKANSLDRYLREVSLLKSQYNPFGDVPRGRIFIINVGANTSSPLQSPIFGDGRFEFVPIREHESVDNDAKITYEDLRQFNHPNRPLLSMFKHSKISPTLQAHNDPEFLTFTYGDNIAKKSNLKDLKKGDYLFFLARLVPYDGKFHHKDAIFALVGYLEIDEYCYEPIPSLFASPAYAKNAHIIRWLASPASFTNFVIFKGSTNSRRFRYAVPFSRNFVEHVPFYKADGSFWEWERTTELGIIGSNTRTARVHIDPKSNDGYERAKRFWQCIWETQKWDKNTKKKSCHC